MSAFKDWMRAGGFNGKQVVVAGALLGWGKRSALTKSAGTTRTTQTDRLAMTAAALGLPAWEPGFADALDDDTKALARLLVERINSRRTRRNDDSAA